MFAGLIFLALHPCENSAVVCLFPAVFVGVHSPLIFAYAYS